MPLSKNNRLIFAKVRVNGTNRLFQKTAGSNTFAPTAITRRYFRTRLDEMTVVDLGKADFFSSMHWRALIRFELVSKESASFQCIEREREIGGLEVKTEEVSPWSGSWPLRFLKPSTSYQSPMSTRHISVRHRFFSPWWVGLVDLSFCASN